MAFNPDKIIIIKDKLKEININDSKRSGPNFCHVDKMRAGSHEIDVITEGYHIWHGAIPAFNISDRNKITDIKWLGTLKLAHIDSLLIKSTLDPKAWARKYFTAASVSWNILVYIMIGINLNKFNSRAIHVNNQFELEIIIIVLIIIVVNASIWNGA